MIVVICEGVRRKSIVSRWPCPAQNSPVQPCTAVYSSPMLLSLARTVLPCTPLCVCPVSALYTPSCSSLQTCAAVFSPFVEGDLCSCSTRFYAAQYGPMQRYAGVYSLAQPCEALYPCAHPVRPCAVICSAIPAYCPMASANLTAQASDALCHYLGAIPQGPRGTPYLPINGVLHFLAREALAVNATAGQHMHTHTTVEGYTTLHRASEHALWGGSWCHRAVRQSTTLGCTSRAPHGSVGGHDEVHSTEQGRDTCIPSGLGCAP